MALHLGLWSNFINLPVSFYANTMDFYYYSSEVELKIRDVVSSWSSFFVYDCFCYSEFLLLLLFHIKLSIVLSISVKFIRISVGKIAFGKMEIFTLLLPPICEHGKFIFRYLLQILSPNTWSSCHTDFSLVWLELFQDILYYFGLY